MLYGNFRQLKFTDVWQTAADFVDDYNDSELSPDANRITTANANVLYWLLYAKYGNSVIASSDLNQFRYGVFSVIYRYGPTWEKRLDVQTKLRALDDANGAWLRQSKTIHNHALNPGNAPTTDELDYISDQNTSTRNLSYLEGYSNLVSLLDDDVSDWFLARFKDLFIAIVQPELPLWYKSTEGEEE